MQASLPRFFLRVSFSACFARLRSCAPRTAAVVRGAFGSAVFAAAKTSGFRAAAREGDNASCGWLHLIRFATLSTFPSRGRLFIADSPKGFPLRGSCRLKGD